jgi:TRAP-type mannitol/chloroaromatic compound transport system permease small subunit
VLALVQRLRGWIERLGRLMGCAAGWLFVVCAFFITADVLGRKFLGVSSKATVEVTGYMLAFGIAWGLTDALTTRAHIRVDVLLTRLPVRLRAYMHALALVFLVVLNFFFVWRGWAVVEESWMFGARDSSALTIPLIIPQGLWAAGMTIFLLLSVAMLVEIVVLLVAGQRERVDRLLGPRTIQEETAEALEAAGVVSPPTLVARR